MSRLSTVHDAIREASIEPRPETPQQLTPATYKVDPAVKDKAAEICENNGTTLSGFLRWCCILLVKDYHPSKDDLKEEVTLLPRGFEGE